MDLKTNVSKDVISIRFADGEEVFHHGEIAENLYISFTNKLNSEIESIDKTTFISYKRSVISRVIYQRSAED